MGHQKYSILHTWTFQARPLPITTPHQRQYTQTKTGRCCGAATPLTLGIGVEGLLMGHIVACRRAMIPRGIKDTVDVTRLSDATVSPWVVETPHLQGAILLQPRPYGMPFPRMTSHQPVTWNNITSQIPTDVLKMAQPPLFRVRKVFVAVKASANPSLWGWRRDRPCRLS